MEAALRPRFHAAVTLLLAWKPLKRFRLPLVALVAIVGRLPGCSVAELHLDFDTRPCSLGGVNGYRYHQFVRASQRLLPSRCPRWMLLACPNREKRGGGESLCLPVEFP